MIYGIGTDICDIRRIRASLERHGDRVHTAPIKGTRRRSPDEQQAHTARQELEGSAKDRAENVMIVDLMRNDLGRVCLPGSVQVTALSHVRPHPGVWHLVSEVQGRLLPGTDDADLLRATFPPGSVTGAPKRAALEVIADDKGIKSDMPAWCSKTGHECLGIEEEDGEFHVFVKKKG